MAVSTSLHFIGKEAVLTAYQNRQVEAWSLWQGRQFLTKGMTVEELEAFLVSLWEETTAIYTLKVYEDVTDIKKVKEKTECDGSFNFRLNERTEPYIKGGYSVSGGSNKRLEELEAKIDMLINRDIEEEDAAEESNGLGAIAGFLGSLFNDPDKFEKTLGVIKGLLQPQAPQPAHIGNVNIIDAGNPSLSPSLIDPMAQQQQTTTAPKKDLTQQELTRLYAAIESLTVHDSNIVQHMEKLASIAANTPAQFKTLIGMLDVF